MMYEPFELCPELKAKEICLGSGYYRAGPSRRWIENGKLLRCCDQASPKKRTGSVPLPTSR